MKYPYTFFDSRIGDKRLRDLIRIGEMPHTTEVIIVRHFGYKHKDRPDLQPYLVELLGITEQVRAPTSAAFAIYRRDNNSELLPHPPLVQYLTIKKELDLNALGSRAVYYHVGSEVTVYIWLARLKRAVAGDGNTSLALTNRNYDYAKFSPVVHERLYYQSGMIEETNGGELLKGGVAYHTIELMKGYDLFTFATSVKSKSEVAPGRKPTHETADELLADMDAAWDELTRELKPHEGITQPDIASKLGYSQRGYTEAMARLGVNYKTWRRMKKNGH